MNSELYSRARRILCDGDIKLVTETRRAAYFVVRGSKGDRYNVSVRIDGTVNCDCFKRQFLNPCIDCSHTFAAKMVLAGVDTDGRRLYPAVEDV